MGSGGDSSGVLWYGRHEKPKKFPHKDFWQKNFLESTLTKNATFSDASILETFP